MEASIVSCGLAAATASASTLCPTHPTLRVASLCRHCMAIPWYKASVHRWNDNADIYGDCHYNVWIESWPGTLAAVPETKTCHVVPPPCFVDSKQATFHASRNKSHCMANETCRSVHSCDRLANEVSSHQLTSYLASKMPGKGHWDSACRFTSAHGRGENRSDRCGCTQKPECNSISCVIKFRLDWLGSRRYVATATMFLMKTANYIWILYAIWNILI